MEEKEQQIIEYLESKGFNIPDLQSTLQQAGSQFQVECSRSFGEELMEYRLKFEWDHQFDNYRWTGYKATYSHENGQVRSQDFIASYVGIAHAYLAYHVLSGRLEDIREKLMKSGIEQYTGTDINAFLETMLSRNPETFTLHVFKNDKEGMIDFDINVSMNDHYYEPSDIEVTFRSYPDIVHGIHNGIDTAELAAKMDGIVWARDDLYEFDEEEMALPIPEAMEILEAMALLQKDEQGREVALNLQLRHWTGTPYFEAYVHDDTWKLYEQLSQQKYSFPIETGAGKIYNLMCGRPVIAGRLTDIEGDFNQWQKLARTDEGLSLVTIEGPSRRELETYLSMLPLDDLYKSQLLAGLFNGDICRTTLYGLHQTEVLVSVDFEQKSLRISTLDGKNIPYNFKLEQAQDPIKIPAQSRVQHKPAVIKKRKNRRGKGF